MREIILIYYKVEIPVCQCLNAKNFLKKNEKMHNFHRKTAKRRFRRSAAEIFLLIQLILRDDTAPVIISRRCLIIILRSAIPPKIEQDDFQFR